MSVYKEIAEERIRQNLKWGVQRLRDDRWLTVLTEEVGEVAKEILEHHDDTTNLRKELIQCAAVIVQWIEAIDDRK